MTMYHKQYKLGDFVFRLASSAPLEMPKELALFTCWEEKPQVTIPVPECENRQPMVTWLLRDMNLRSLLLERSAIVLHASYIIHNGKAILFTAPSQVGKSTQAALWEKYRGAEIINGDRALLQRTVNGFTANGIFYCGSSGICKNVTAPLQAVVVLKQGDNKLQRIGGLAAFKAILPQSAYDIDKPQDIELASSIIAGLIGAVPVFQLDAAADEQSVVVLENALKG